MTTAQRYETFTRKMQRIADIRNANAVLQWDQETYLPSKGAAFRGQQISTLSEISHQLFTEDALGHLMQDLLSAGDLSQVQRRNVELTLEDYVKNKKYSSEFVRRLSDQVNKTFHCWIEARKQNSFLHYMPDLAQLVELKKQEAEILGYKGTPYNALLNEYEKGATTSLLDKTFGELLPRLKTLFDQVMAAPQVDDTFLKQHFPRQQQWDWGMYLVRELNFDLEAGRQDISEHPFSISFNPRDVRITTRIAEDDFANMTWSCIHEVGHALYEQGLPEEHYGLPLGEACSFSIHESQSRLWENNVGRGFHFWKHYFPALQQQFPEQLGKKSLQEFYSAMNKVQPSLVRTEADEITYHFHVYIRYELEKNLLQGTIGTGDIPTFWAEQYHRYLGLAIPDDRQGALQDVHWSHGSFGYFPTYSLGSFYAAQFYHQAVQDLPGLEAELEQGNTKGLLKWLRNNIHTHGRYFLSEDLCRQVTGQPLDVSYFVNYLLNKYSSIYNF